MKEQEWYECFGTITPTEDYHKYVVIVEGADAPKVVYNTIELACVEQTRLAIKTAHQKTRVMIARVESIIQGAVTISTSPTIRWN